MSLLDDDFVSIPLYYYYREGKYGSKQLIVLEDDKAAEMLEDTEAKQKVEVLNTKWKKMNWKEDNDLMKACEKVGEAGEMPGFDWSRYQDQRVKMSLQWWDLKQKAEDLEPMPVNNENIDKMPGHIIRALLERFEAATSITDAEMGKL